MTHYWEEQRQEYTYAQSPRNRLIWLTDHTLYELFTYGQLVERFRPDDDELWLRWLDTQTSFTFQGAVVWQMIPLHLTFLLYEGFLREGALLVPRLQDAKQRVTANGNRFVMIKVMQWLVVVYHRAGQLRLVHQECLAAFDMLGKLQAESRTQAIARARAWSLLG